MMFWNDGVEMLFWNLGWMMFLNVGFRRVLWNLGWMLFWNDGFMRLLWKFCWMKFLNDGFEMLFWNDGKSVGGCAGLYDDGKMGKAYPNLYIYIYMYKGFMHPGFGLCTLFLAVHSSLTDINDVNSSRAMNPACRPHSKQRSATDSFGWPSNPSVRSSGSRRNSGCPPGRTWDVSWEAAGNWDPQLSGSQGDDHGWCLKPPYTPWNGTTFLGATQGPSWSLLFL